MPRGLSARDIAAMETHAIDSDDLWPRNEQHRFRIYAVAGAHMEVLAATPSAEGIGTAIVTLYHDGKETGHPLADRGRLGVMDVMPDGEPSEHGEWIVNPFERGAHI